jgi:hypothetical protein
MSYYMLCPDEPLSTGCSAEKKPGTQVYLGANTGPVYEIVFIAGNTAWVRKPITFRDEALVPLDRLRVVNSSACTDQP